MIKHHKNFPSELIAPHQVDVWVPATIIPGECLPVLYMQDGQNLLDPAHAYGKVDWGVDEAITRLVHTTRSRGAIVVAIWNNAQRQREYMPLRPMKSPAARHLLDQFTAREKGDPLGELYLRFIVAELKPFIDSHYPTLPDQPHTFIMGSSMGGLISAFALCEFPHIFAGAACLSTHWTFGGMPMVEGIGSQLPPPGQHRLYFDHGTGGLDADYAPFQERMDVLLQGRGYTPDVDLMSLKFEGASHNESAWRERVHMPLEFLLT
jgi:predicted alpha/beta superfamily hydrolase